MVPQPFRDSHMNTSNDRQRDDYEDTVHAESMKFAINILGESHATKPTALRSMKEKRTVSSPLKVQLAESIERQKIPYYRNVSTDGKGVRYIHFKPIATQIIVKIKQEDVRDLLNLKVNSDGNLERPTWNDNLNIRRSDYFKELMEGSTPKHIVISVKNSEIMNLKKDGGKTKGKRGGRKKRHSLLCHCFGGCQHKADVCVTRWSAGFEEDQLLIVAKRNSDTQVEMKISFFNSCDHIVNKTYGKLSGQARQRQIKRIIETADKLIKPSELAKRNLYNLDKETFAAGNLTGVAATCNKQYEINRAAKKKKTEKWGIGKCKLANAIAVSRRIREEDIAERSKAANGKTYSKLYPGILQHSGFHDGYLMELWTKKTIELYNEVLQMGLIAYIDGTGGLTYVDGSTVSFI